MMGTKIFFLGFAILLALPVLLTFLKVDVKNVDVVGAIVVIIGIILIWLDR